MATQIKPMEFPLDQNSEAFNRKFHCVLCRKSKKPFQMGREVVIRVIHGKEVAVTLEDMLLCLDHNEPSFTSPTARAKVHDYHFTKN